MEPERTTVAEACCQSCGCVWFEIAGEDTDPTEYKGLGAMRIDGAGRMLAYSGALICYECGERLVTPQFSVIPAQLDEDTLTLLSLSLPPLITTDEMGRAADDPPAIPPRKIAPRIDPSRAAPD